THIIHKWPGDALKVVTKAPVTSGEWVHLFVTYDGSGKAAGVNLYVDGFRQEKEVLADTLAGTTRTTVPLTLAQRHNPSRLDGLLVQDARIYARAPGEAEVGRIGRTTRAAWLAAKPADARTAAEKDELLAWWLPAFDAEYPAL